MESKTIKISDVITQNTELLFEKVLSSIFQKESRIL